MGARGSQGNGSTAARQVSTEQAGVREHGGGWHHQAAEAASAEVTTKYNQWKLQYRLDVKKQMDRHQE